MQWLVLEVVEAMEIKGKFDFNRLWKPVDLCTKFHSYDCLLLPSDAGVARDSVVNQLLAKMDGVEPLCVPTLVIGKYFVEHTINQLQLNQNLFLFHIVYSLILCRYDK